MAVIDAQASEGDQRRVLTVDKGAYVTLINLNLTGGYAVCADHCPACDTTASMLSACHRETCSPRVQAERRRKVP